jgi:UbiD family decarboxylase
MYEDLRIFLRALSEQGWLAEVKVEVDPEWEIGAVCRENFNRIGPALVFSRVKGFKTPLVVGVLGTPEMYGLALGCEPKIAAFVERWSRALNFPIKVLEVKEADAPCKEVKLDKIDLYRDPFPVPRWHPLDAGPELGTFYGCITKDPETGWINIGTYRLQILEKDKVGCLAPPYKHIIFHWHKWKEIGKPMPIAIAIGLDPYLNMVSVAAVPVQVNEYDIAGGLKGDPIKVVKAETSDLLVPANAEIILEGEMPTDEFYSEEGPFGEFTGYMGERRYNSHFIRINTITHRHSPYFQGTYEGRPPNESMMSRGIGQSCALYEFLKKSGCPGVKDVCATVGGSGALHAVVSIKKFYPGHARVVMALVWAFPQHIKHVVVVDDDIDVWNPIMVEWAIATRVQASRDIVIIPNAHGSVLDPSQVTSKRGLTDWFGIDATIPEEEYKRDGSKFPPFADPPQEIMDKIKQSWNKYGIK